MLTKRHMRVLLLLPSALLPAGCGSAGGAAYITVTLTASGPFAGSETQSFVAYSPGGSGSCTDFANADGRFSLPLSADPRLPQSTISLGGHTLWPRVDTTPYHGPGTYRGAAEGNFSFVEGIRVVGKDGIAAPAFQVINGVTPSVVTVNADGSGTAWLPNLADASDAQLKPLTVTATWTCRDGVASTQ